MTVTFLMHGVLIRLAGSEAITLDCQTQCSIQDALERLATEAPDLESELNRTACAIGEALVTRDTLITTDVEIALIPPVSGG